ncbi:MAG: hypothetical protein GXO93_03675 [FCB group bacterium]|nr:hypothetical protein [FCB group bacterium]
MKKFILVAIIVYLIFAIVIQTEAFDGKRDGFVLGFGLGAGKVYFSKENHTGLSTDFKIGAGVSKHVVLFWANQFIWYSGLTYYRLNGIGGAYYFKPSSPSLYFTGAIGLATLGTIDPVKFRSDGISKFGMGFGVGYEFSKNYSFEANYLTEPDATGIKITINGLAY